MRLQQDNDSLQGKQSLHVSLQLAEDFILPDTVEVLRELVSKYRENIIHVRTAADHMEEKLKAEILFLKEQIQAEQCLKENLEEPLQLEIENCKEEIGEKKMSLWDWGAALLLCWYSIVLAWVQDDQKKVKASQDCRRPSLKEQANKQ